MKKLLFSLIANLMLIAGAPALAMDTWQIKQAQIKLNKQLNSELNFAVMIGSKDLVAELLAKGAHANATSDHDRPVLMIAAEQGYKDVCEELIKHGADVNAIYQGMGWNSLDRAATNGHLEVCKLLIKNGAKINPTSDEIETELLSAATNGHTKICELLISHNANVNVKGHLGWDPLTCATLNNHKEACELLITQGANINSQDNQGNTALSQLLDYYSVRPEVCKLLIAKGTDLTIRNTKGFTPLMLAARRGSSGERKQGMLLTDMLLDSITTLLPAEKELIKNWLYTNKKLQKMGKPYMPKDMRIHVTQHITCLLAEKLQERVIQAGIQEAILLSQDDSAMTCLLETYNNMKDLAWRVEQQIKWPKVAHETQSLEIVTETIKKLKITEEENE